ncbi:MAG: HEAT repeat domain-containing protein, partial [Anaerolineae bacterium]
MSHEPRLSSGRSGREPGISLPRRVERLLETLRTQEGIARWEAVHALGRMGYVAVPGLLTLLKGTDGDVRGYAAIALGRIGDVRALPA